MRCWKRRSCTKWSPGDRTKIGPFEIEFIHVTHSTIDCVALAMRTPVGVIIHTGDFKMDPTPMDGMPFDLHAFARYGQEGVLALFSDSTNVERPGFTPSERAVWMRMEELFRAAPRKVLVSCFASSIHRIQQMMDIAAAVGRKVGFVGRSMVDNVEIAHTLGRLRIPDGRVVRPQDLRSSIRRKLVILVSGSQAEPMSSLSRIAVDNHRLLSVDRERHGDSFRAHHSRQRKGDFPHDGPHVPPPSAGLLRKAAARCTFRGMPARKSKN